MRRPIDTRTKELLEPAHKFEVALEPDDFTQEKCEMPPSKLAYAVLIIYHTDTHFLQIIRKRSITKVLPIFRRAVSDASFAPAYLGVAVYIMVKRRRWAPTISATA